MKTKKENWKSFIVTLTMALFMATMLMACSSKAAPVEDIKETEAAAIKEENVEVAEVKEAEPTPESTAEPTPEPIVYEGIDMESTLPGEQWVASFDGIIDELKLVIFNNETNKKVILEEGQEVDFALTDKVAIHIPDGHNGGYIKNRGFIFDENMNYNSSGITVLDNISSSCKVGDSVPLEVLLTYDGEDMTISAILNIVN